MRKTDPQRKKTAARTFQAALERMRSRLNWVIIRIPFDVGRVWGTRGQLRVRGEMNGSAFRSALFPTREGRHFLLVNKRMQEGARAYAGMTADFRMEPDLEPRPAAVPAELNRILAQDRSLLGWFRRLSPSARAEIGKWVAEPKNASARGRRADQMAERMLATMEAEQELPPVLRLAFGRDPAAYEGWQVMSPSKRRGHLFGIFSYRTPEARERRVQKMLDEAAGLAERARRKRQAG